MQPRGRVVSSISMQSESQSLQHWSIAHERGKKEHSYVDTYAFVKFLLTVIHKFNHFIKQPEPSICLFNRQVPQPADRDPGRDGGGQVEPGQRPPRQGQELRRQRLQGRLLQGGLAVHKIQDICRDFMQWRYVESCCYCQTIRFILSSSEPSAVIKQPVSFWK